MNTIDDLRGTLADHADITDTDLGDRSASIANRVRVVRRRRAAAVGLGAAAVVAAAAVGVSLPHAGHEVAPATRLLGVTVPKTMTATGYTYDFERSVTGSGDTAQVRLGLTNDPVLVSWVTEGSDQRVSVHTGADNFVSNSPDFGDYAIFNPGAGSARVRVTGHSHVALAVYRLDAKAPAGVTRDGITFRAQVAGNHLMRAKISRVGASRLDFSFTVRAAHPVHLGLTYFCRTTDRPADHGHTDWVTTTVNGRPFTQGGSCGPIAKPFDPGAGDVYGSAGLFRPGQHVRVTMRLLDKSHGGHPVTAPRSLLGAGMYAEDAPVHRLGHGLDAAPETLEYAGHTWRLATSRSGLAHAGAPFTVPVPDPSERMLTYVTTRPATAKGAMVQVVVDGTGGLDLFQGGGTEYGRYVEPGAASTAGLRVVHDTAPVWAGVALYRRAD